MSVSVQFIEGLDEEISNISLRKRRNSETKIIVLTFERLQAIEKLRAYRKKISHLWLKDEEGNIQVTPTGVQFIFAGDDDLARAECSFEVDSDDVFERVMRFFHRYAEVHGFEFQGT